MENKSSIASQRGKSPKAGKGVGRKPATETLKPLNVKIPVSCWEWTDKQGNKSAYITRLIVKDFSRHHGESK